MTDPEKKMKKYVNSIERHLNLPAEVKARVMSDFSSSIQARRESGMSDDEIYAEIGDAKKAADDLNEQMKEFAYRKSPWRFLFAVMAVYGAGKLLSGLWVNILYLVFRAQAMLTPGESASVGIIGGADGPTAIFLTSPVWMPYVLSVVLLAVGIWGFIRLSKCTKEQ